MCSFWITRLGIRSSEESASAFRAGRLWKGIPAFVRSKRARAKALVRRRLKVRGR